jgi:hypothetical protein
MSGVWLCHGILRLCWASLRMTSQSSSSSARCRVCEDSEEAEEEYYKMSMQSP